MHLVIPIIKMAYTRQNLENIEKWQAENAFKSPKILPIG